MKKFKIVSRILFLLNGLTAISLLLAYSASYVNPSIFWPISFFGLALPYFLIFNILFLVYWIFRGSKKLFLSLIILVLGYKSIPAFFQLRLNTEVVKESDLKIMSFNVRVFDLYMWTKDKKTRNKIFDLLVEEDPDVICLQEFYHTTNHSLYEFKTLDTLVQILSAKNYHAQYAKILRKTDHWGIITLSKYPIVGKGAVEFAIKDDNQCSYTDIDKDGQIIRIYNAHLASIKLDKYDYKAMQAVNKNDYSEDFDKELMMLSKIRYGFERRSLQSDSIAKHIQSSPYPCILAGDFNDTPASYAYHTIKGNMKDAFIEAGSGLGLTYIGDFPSFRIDYLLHDEKFVAKKYKTHPEELSDHHPISTYLEVK